MAKNKSTRSRKRRKEPPYRRVLRFPEVKGKIIDLVELGSSPDDYTIEIRFQDKTALTFGIEPCVNGFPELCDWKTGEYKPIKRWPPKPLKLSVQQRVVAGSVSLGLSVGQVLMAKCQWLVCLG